MIEALRRRKTLLAAIAMVVVPLVVYRAQSRDGSEATPLDRAVVVLMSPLDRLLAAVVDGVATTWSRYVDVVGARDENVTLRRELGELARARDAQAGIEAENQRLRTLLGLAGRNPRLGLLTAKVVAASTSPLERTVQIDRGLQHGVRRGMPVIAHRGLVGRVQRCGYGYAVVALIADEKVSLDVVIGRSRVHGRLQGTGLWPAARLDVIHVLRTEDVRVNDVVLTSGLAGVYPEDVPVALVSKVDSTPGGQELIIEVTPLVDLTRLEEVMVVTGPSEPGEPMVTPDELLPEELQAPRTSSTATAARAAALPDAGTSLDGGGRR